jgi:Outer membrane protein
MKCRNAVIGILTVLLGAASLWAEGTELTIDDAVKYASENNLSIQEGQITLNALKRTNDFSWNSISPTVTGTAGYSKPNEKTTYEYQEYIEGSVSVALKPSLYTTMRAALLNYENGKITYTEAVRAVELSVRKAFYNLLYQKENIVLQQRNLDTANEQYNQNLAKYKSGQLSELDMLSSEVNYKTLKPTLESAQVTYNNNLASFKQVLGIDQNTDITLSGSLDDVLKFKDIVLPSDSYTVPSVLAAQKNVEIAQNSLLAQRFSAYGPSLSAEFMYGKIKTDLTDTLSTAGSVTLGVSIPLDGYLPWSADALSVSSAKDTLKKAELSLLDEKTTASVNTQTYLSEIKQAQSQLESLQANIDLAQKTYDMTLTAYNHGSKDLLSLQDAADSLLKAKVSLRSEEYTLISAVLNLESTLGVPFGTLGK